MTLKVNKVFPVVVSLTTRLVISRFGFSVTTASAWASGYAATVDTRSARLLIADMKSILVAIVILLRGIVNCSLELKTCGAQYCDGNRMGRKGVVYEGRWTGEE